MSSKLESEINSEEMDLYDYWEVLVKRKKVFIGIFLIPIVIAAIISYSMPRLYRGECEISIPLASDKNIVTVFPAPKLVSIIGNIDDTKKEKVFTNIPVTIKSVSVSLNKKSTDKVRMVIEAKTADVIPQAFKDMANYIGNLPEIKEEIDRIKEEHNSKLNRLTVESNLRIKKLLEAKKANLNFLNYVNDMIKTRQISFVAINPADLILKDYNLSLEITNLQQVKKDVTIKRSKSAVVNTKDSNDKDEDLESEITNLRQSVVTFGILGPLSISMHPSKAEIRKIIISTGALSLVAAIFVVFFLLDYIDRIKMQRNKRRSS